MPDLTTIVPVTAYYRINYVRDTVADIEQPLTGRNVIKPTDLFPK